MSPPPTKKNIHGLISDNLCKRDPESYFHQIPAPGVDFNQISPFRKDSKTSNLRLVLNPITNVKFHG